MLKRAQEHGGDQEVDAGRKELAPTANLNRGARTESVGRPWDEALDHQQIGLGADFEDEAAGARVNARLDGLEAAVEAG